MSDETAEAPDPEADAEAEEAEVEAPAPAALDSKAIVADAEARVTKMQERGRSKEDIDSTYAGFVLGLTNQTGEAFSAALRAEADRRTADEQMKKGPYNRRRLAVQVASGSFNVPSA